MARVVDSSVIIKWFVDEGDGAGAVALIGTALVAPELVLAEVGNALWKKWRRGEIQAEQVRAATSFVSSFVGILSCQPVADLALEIALDLDHPVYDCYFLAMAGELNTQLLTYDRRLMLKCADSKYGQHIEYLGKV